MFHWNPLYLSILLPLAAACGPTDTGPQPVDVQLDLSREVHLRHWAPYGLGQTQRRGCSAPQHRQFDFWLGRWQVDDTAGSPQGSNRIELGLGGCVVLEHWVDAGGAAPGRSINLYDRLTGTWHQYWVDAAGTTIILEGGSPRRGSMVMTQSRPIRFGGPIGVDRVTWSRTEGGQVTQAWDRSLDNGVTYAPVFRGVYQRGQPPSPPLGPGSTCTNHARPRFHYFDFTLGSWSVSEANSQRRLGRADISRDVGGCLLEMRFSGPGYQAIGFGSLDFTDRLWYRELVDDRGVRVALRGDLVGSDMVMTGSAGAGPERRSYRVTWSPVSPDQFTESWESTEDGITFVPTARLTFRRAL